MRGVEKLEEEFYACNCTGKGSKNISIKMLKDVGMTVPKSRETSAVYMCSNTRDEGSIYAARQGMRAVYMQQDRG